MTDEAISLREQAEQYKWMYRANQISRSEALEGIQPYLDYANKKSCELARKYHVRPKLITAAGFLR